MELSNKNIDNILKMVNVLPSDYTEKRNYLISKIKEHKIENNYNDLGNWMHTFIYKLPQDGVWKRKHVYRLVHEILNSEFSTDELDEILYDIESGIIGNCAVNSIDHYPGEPEDTESLVSYVRDYKWLQE